MKQVENNSANTASYLLEHSHGTCELWIERGQTTESGTYVPLKLMKVSGRSIILLRTEMIAEAIALEQWMTDHLEVFTNGRTSDDTPRKKRKPDDGR
ncbi:MAG: hypothetical protein RIK87_22415 [Fuerstiella sp.]